MQSRRHAALLRCVSVIALSSVIVSAPAWAADVTGRVIDAKTGLALPGATVRLKDKAATAATGQDGTFSLRGLPDGDVTLTVTYQGFSARDVTVKSGANGEVIALSTSAVDEKVEVVGRRFADPRGVQVKRTSRNTVESLFADEVGNLPDQNVAESVRRLPGVSVANDQGEGRYVIVRGAGPDQVNVAINGVQLGAPEPEARQVKLDGIPSSFISQVQVIKTLTPDLDANAVGGTVNIVTLSAFDRKDPLLAGSIASGKFDLNGKTPFEVEGTMATRFSDTVGLVIAGNWSKRDYESENVQGSTTWVPTALGNVPNDFRLRDYNLERKRSGVVANLDWRPTDEIKTFARVVYSSFNDTETRDQFRIELPVASVTSQTATSGEFLAGTSVRGTRFVRFRQEDEKIRGTTVGGSYEDAEQKLALEASYSNARKLDPNRNEFEFRSGGSALAPATYDLSAVLLNVTPNPAAYTPATYAFRRVRFVNRDAQEDLGQFKIDYTRFVNIMGGEAALQAGLKYANRDKSYDQAARYFNAGAAFNLGTTPSLNFIGKPSLFDGKYVFGPRVSYDGSLAFFNANPGNFAADLRGSAIDAAVADFQANEKLTSGYAMVDWKMGDLQLVAGVRVENTDANYRAKTLDFTVPTPVDPGFNTVFTSEYTDVFPSVNVRYEVVPDLVLRGAVTTAIGRPNYEDLAPTTLVDGTSVTIGNPGLKPLKSVNYDAGLEYYFGSFGTASVAVFQKNIEDPIYRQTTPVIASIATPVTFGGTTFTAGTVNVNQARNAAEGEVRGIELNLQGKASFLPYPFDGLGVSGNVAFIDSEATIPGRADKVPFFLQSNRVATLQAFYENDGIELRVAYTMRTKYLDEASATTPLGDIYVADFAQLDARAAYAFNDNVTVFVEGVNLDDEPWRRWVGKENQLVENERYGFTTRFGLEMKY